MPPTCLVMLINLKRRYICVFVLAQYERTVTAVYEADGSVEMMVKLLQIYKRASIYGGVNIFVNTCMLLGIMGFDEHRRRVSSLSLGMHQILSPPFGKFQCSKFVAGFPDLTDFCIAIQCVSTAYS